MIPGETQLITTSDEELFELSPGGKTDVSSLYRFSDKPLENINESFSFADSKDDAPIDPWNIKPRDRFFTPYNALLMGRRNAGKTLAMTALAKIMKGRYQKWKIPFKIMTNYTVKFADICNPYIVDDIVLFKSNIRGGYLCIDELQSVSHNRRSMSKASVGLIQFLTEIRKRQIELVCTTQFPQYIDIQVLYQIDFFIEVEKLFKARAVRFFIHDFWGQFTGKNWRKPWPPYRWEADLIITLYGTNKVFLDYNTFQVVAPIGLDQEARESLINTEWKEDDLKGWEEEMGKKVAEMERQRPNLNIGADEPLGPVSSQPTFDLSTPIGKLLLMFPEGEFDLQQHITRAKDLGLIKNTKKEEVEYLIRLLGGHGYDTKKVATQYWVQKNRDPAP